MQMTAKPVVAASAPPPDAIRAAPEASNAVDAAAVRRSWFGKALSSFIDMIEPAVRLAAPRKRLVAVISADGQHIAFHLVTRRRRTAPIGDGTGEKGALVKALKCTKLRSAELRLDPDRLAARQFKIPAAGAELAHQIVRSRLDRLTPWRPDAVVYGFALSNKAGPDGQLDVDFVATSLDIVTADVARLGEFGLSASALGSAEQPITEPLRVDLFAGRNDISRRTRRRRIGVGSIATILVAAIVCGITFQAMTQSRERVAELDATIAKARNRLVNASGSTAGRDQDFAFIAAKKPAEARFLLINRLATILPDNTYLDELDIEPSSIRIAGSSTDVSALIRLLEADAVFNDAKFSAPVTRQDDGRDRFEITALHGAKPADASP